MDTSETVVSAQKKPVEQAGVGPDPGWKGVYSVGGMGMIVTGAIFLLGAVFAVMIGPPPSGSEPYLKALAEHAKLALANFGLFTLTDFLLLPAVMALYLSLKHISKNAMLIAAGLMLLYVFLDLAVTELNSLTLVALARRYATTTNEVQRSAAVAAASYALATLPIATFCSYVVSSIGFLIVSVVMLKGVFSKLTAYVGIVACIEGIVGGFYVVLPPLAVLLVPSLIAFGIFSSLAGLRLYALGRH